ncbi:CHAT domain-containing protein [Streptomyces sp. NPDC058739]|uniref:CHAT domain-containing protein n=1 Tax=Streptomyces sp. NPDC058739 TaxID=3346618 RepID=UPI00368A6C0E
MAERENLPEAVRARLRRALDGRPCSSQPESAAVAAGHLARIMGDQDPEARHALGRRLMGTSGALAESDEAVAVGRQAVKAHPPGHSDRAKSLSDLGIALGTRFERAGAVADIDEAVTVGRQAVEVVPLDHPHRAIYCSNLGNSLRLRFGRFDAQADIDEAVAVSRQAVEAVPLDHPDRAMFLGNLGNSLGTRFGRFGAEADIDEAVAVGRRAVEAAPVDHPQRAMYLGNLGNSLRIRFDRYGAPADLEEAVAVGREAVEEVPADHPHRAMFLSGLGNSLRARFDRFGALADLDAAITAGRRAVGAVSVAHPDRAMFLNGLGSSLGTRYKRSGALGDLDAAIAVGREALAATPADHPDRAMFLSNLGTSLRARFDESGALGDLDAAIAAEREALAATPADHADRAMFLNSRALALHARYGKSGVPADLDAAVAIGRRAVEATPTDRPLRTVFLSNLGILLQTRYERSGAEADLDEAVRVQVAAAKTDSAAPSARARAGRAAGRLLASSDSGLAARMLEDAVRLLPEVAPWGLDRSDQQELLGGLSGLAGDAAALALDDMSVPAGDRAGRALGLLESGRALLLAQVMEVRGDLTDLREHHPDLARRFAEVREVLDRVPSGPVGSAGVDADPSFPGGEDRGAGDRRRVAAELGALLGEIRGLEGFASFGLPPVVEDLLAAAGPGPVVTFNVTGHRCDALLLTTRGVTALELPALTPEAVIARGLGFHRALAECSDPTADRVAAQQRVRDVLAWLWDSAVGPVLDALGFTGPACDGGEWPRVWWVAGGLLSLLPLHAAGHHTESADPGYRTRTALDRVVSSYTPTIGALGHARRHVKPPPGRDRALIVAMPWTPGLPGQGRLAAATREAARLHARLPDPVLLTAPEPEPEPETGPGDAIGPQHTIDPGADKRSTETADGIATRAAVFARLPEATIAHFACHGSSHPTDPSRSLLLLHDWQHDPLTVASLSPVSLDAARLAYLSACSTTLSLNPRLLDESIHLTAAFQLAGFPHVIGTLWQINDRYAADIADAFYTHLTDSQGNIDTDRAAQALHRTVRALRDRLPITPSLWAAHLHAGA